MRRGSILVECCAATDRSRAAIVFAAKPFTATEKDREEGADEPTATPLASDSRPPSRHGHLLGGFLFGIEPTEPAVLLAAAATLLVVALLAGSIASLAAARVDPARTLRGDN